MAEIITQFLDIVPLDAIVYPDALVGSVVLCFT